MAKKRENITHGEAYKRILAAGLVALTFVTGGCALKGEVSGASESKPTSSSSKTLSGISSSEEVYVSSLESKVSGAVESASSSVASSKVESSTPSKEYTSTPEKDRAKVLPYMAGGEYIENTIYPLIDNRSGATVVISGNTEPLTQDALNNSVINKIRGNLKSTDVVYVQNGEAYVLNSDNLKSGYRKITKYGQDGSKSIVENTNKSICYSLKVVFDENMGICLSDGTRITYQLSNGKYVELENPIMLGTQEQRIGHQLKSLLNGAFNNQKNPLNLNSNEVNQYLSTGSDEGLNSFQVIKSQEAAFVVVTGGEWGLNELYTKSVRRCVARFDEIDPNIMKDLVEKRGLQVVTYDMQADPNFSASAHPSWSATFWSYDFGRVIYLNQAIYTKYLGQYDMDNVIETMNPSIMFKLWGESEGNYTLENTVLSPNQREVEKYTWVLYQLEKYKDKLDPIKEYKLLVTDANNGIKRFS